MNQNTDDIVKTTDYHYVRDTFNLVLQRCVDKLTKTDLRWAQSLLELDFLEQGDDVLLTDTALFSPQKNGKRAVDRIVPRLATKREPLMEAIAAKIPNAFFSIFHVDTVYPEGRLVVKDLLDNGRPLQIIDKGLAATAVAGALFAARLLDLGPWHIGFGIIIPLLKSESVAIALALSAEADLAEKRSDLHELLYVARIHEEDLVLMATAPMISILAMSIDQSSCDVTSLINSFKFPPDVLG